jgi:hypothetical protein
MSKMREFPSNASTLASETSFSGAVVRISVIALVCLLLSATGARADSVTYTYTGNAFTNGTSPYTPGDSVTGMFVLSTPLADDITSLTDESGVLDSYSISDGVQMLTNATPGIILDAFSFTTNSSGGITGWDIEFLTALTGIETEKNFPALGESLDEGCISPTPPACALVMADPGSWSVAASTTVSEPGTLSMTFSGLLGLCLLVGVKRYRGNRLQP